MSDMLENYKFGTTIKRPGQWVFIRENSGWVYCPFINGRYIRRGWIPIWKANLITLIYQANGIVESPIHDII